MKNRSGCSCPAGRCTTPALPERFELRRRGATLQSAREPLAPVHLGEQLCVETGAAEISWGAPDRFLAIGSGVVEAVVCRRGSMFSPPAICGLDGSNPSFSSRLRTRSRARLKASLRFPARRSAVLKKASPK